MFPFTCLFPTIHCDAGKEQSTTTPSVLSTVKSAVAGPESELKRWRKAFDANAKVEINGEKWAYPNYLPPRGHTDGISCARFMDQDDFVNAIAPSGDLSKIARSQFAILFRVADSSKRGLVSWSDFTVFETVLKRPDADYWIAFQYFDVSDTLLCSLIPSWLWALCLFTVIVLVP